MSQALTHDALGEDFTRSTLQSPSFEHPGRSVFGVLSDSTNTPILPTTSSSCVSQKPLLSPSSFSQTLKNSINPNMQRSISSFSIIGTLGQGTSGKVILGRPKDGHPRGLCAIKVISKGLSHRYTVAEQERELHAFKCISSNQKLLDGVQFLQKMLGNFQDEKSSYIVLEYHPIPLSDPEIASRLIQKIPPNTGMTASASLPLSFSCSIQSAKGRNLASLRLLAAEIVLGLLFLHRNGLVHQDIKPANIMISSGGHVVISDFGASHMLSRSRECSPRSLGSIVLQPHDIVTFTPLYAAPEILHRNMDNLVVYDERIDWWSLGILLYEMVTGSLPFLTAEHKDAEGPSPNRRSVGNFSLAFGALEKLTAAGGAGCRAQQSTWDPHLDDLLRSLLVHDREGRLSGLAVQAHPFFDSISCIWTEIAALQHPPLPNPPFRSFSSDSSFGNNKKTPDTSMSSLEVFLSPQPPSPTSPQMTHTTQSQYERLGREESRSRPSANGLRESDSRSEIQPFPSTASLIDASLAHFHKSTQDAGGSSLKFRESAIATNTLGLVIEEGEGRSTSAAAACPTYEDEFIPHSSSGARCGISGTTLERQQYTAPSKIQKSWTMEEKLTISLLQAMSSRDENHLEDSKSNSLIVHNGPVKTKKRRRWWKYLPATR